MTSLSSTYYNGVVFLAVIESSDEEEPMEVSEIPHQKSQPGECGYNSYSQPFLGYGFIGQPVQRRHF